MRNVNPGALFIRDRFVGPPNVTVETHTAEHGWSEVLEKEQVGLDLKVRNAGWHFFWIAASFTRRGFGRSFEAAGSHSVQRSLNVIGRSYNAAEIERVENHSVFGVHVSRVTLRARQIQSTGQLAPRTRSR